MNQARVRRVGDAAVVDLAGRLVAGHQSGLLPAIQRLLEAGERKIVLSLARVKLIDTAGLGDLVSAVKQIRQQGGRTCFCGVKPTLPPPCFPVFAFYETEAEAIESLQ